MFKKVFSQHPHHIVEMLGSPPGTTAILQSPLSTSKPCGLGGKSSSAAGVEWGRWVRICSRPIGVHIVSPSSMDTARHMVRLPKSGWNRKTLCCLGRRKKCTWLGRLAMVGLAVTKHACKLSMAAGHGSGGWRMRVEVGRSLRPVDSSEPVWRSAGMTSVLPGAGGGMQRGGVGAGGRRRAGAAEKTVNALALPRPLPLGSLALARCSVWVWFWYGVLPSLGGVRSLSLSSQGTPVRTALDFRWRSRPVSVSKNDHKTCWPAPEVFQRCSQAQHSRRVIQSCSF